MFTNALFVVGFVWLLALTVAFVGIVRHLGAVQAAGTSIKPPDGGWLFDTDGPFIPSDLPDRAIPLLNSAGVDPRNLIVTFFSSGCVSCVEHARSIAASVRDPSNSLFLVTGRDKKLVAAMESILEPSRAKILFDPDAHDFVKSLGINSTPFVVRIADGRVVDKAFIRDVTDYMRVAESSRVVGIEANGSDAALRLGQ